MGGKSLPGRLIYSIFRLFLSVKESSEEIKNLRKILVIRQHNQFGDLLASVSLFRAIKESYPESELSVVVSPDNHYAVTKNKYIDITFLFDKSRLYSPGYLKELFLFLRKKYDVVIVPATVSISTTSCLLARFSNSVHRIGPEILNGKKNPVDFVFNKKVSLDWRKYPDSHVSDFCLDIIRPFGMGTKDFTSQISIDENDSDFASGFIRGYLKAVDKKVFGFHVGAGKPQNRWALENFAEVINKLKQNYNAVIYLTGSKSDMHEINYVKDKLEFEVGLFLNKTIPQLAAVISQSDLFVTNDTGVMHVAGTTDTLQISLFGPTNPFNWAPLGNKKHFLRKSELINDIKVNEVITLADKLLNTGGNLEK